MRKIWQKSFQRIILKIQSEKMSDFQIGHFAWLWYKNWASSVILIMRELEAVVGLLSTWTVLMCLRCITTVGLRLEIQYLLLDASFQIFQIFQLYMEDLKQIKKCCSSPQHFRTGQLRNPPQSFYLTCRTSWVDWTLSEWGEIRQHHWLYNVYLWWWKTKMVSLTLDWTKAVYM